MNWEAVGAVAELLGALGVIASLIYLAQQIRHNSKIVQGSTEQAVADSAQARLLTAASSESLAEVMSKLRAGEFETLTETQSRQAFYYRHAQFRGYENVFFQHRDGLAAGRTWDNYAKLVRRQFDSEQDLRDWWSKSGGIYDREFQIVVEGLLAEIE
ncbi:MAG: hypothetical protein ACI9ON_002393 [Limisphaerales bacterium]|jgi:hypothetical protein